MSGFCVVSFVHDITYTFLTKTNLTVSADDVETKGLPC